MRAPKPIELAGIPQGGIETSGESIWFSLESQEGQTFSFSCPHEAVTEIVEKLTGWADLAWKARGSPDQINIPEGTPLKARARNATGFRFEYAKQGIVLSIVCGPLTYQILLTPEQCTRLSEGLAQSRKEWDIRSRPN